MPTFLKAYASNAKYYGHEDVDFIVVGDKKSPEGIAQLCASIEDCTYLSPEDQDKYLHSAGHYELRDHLPWNTIARRNVGHLMAYERGADVIIMLDDDNLATSHDFITQHGITGTTGSCRSLSSRSGWLNVCDALEEEHGVRFYARGYPPAQRWNDGSVTSQGDEVTVAVNAGLWINDPDIDAITRLERRLITTGIKPNWPQKFALYPGTWSPWNCQNTAISRAALPSYFLSPYTGRHLDIWASYITTRIAEHFGESIAFGAPLAFHDRSPHNLYSDLRAELPWIEQTDELCDTLRRIQVNGASYHEALFGLINHLQTDWKATDREAKAKYLKGLYAWHTTFSRIIK